MAKKNENDAGVLLLAGILGTIITSVFLINTYLVYQYYNKKYDFKAATDRVTDTWNFVKYVLGTPGIIIICVMFAGLPAFFLQNGVSSLGRILIIIWVILCLIVAIIWLLLDTARMATTQAGLLIYKDRGYFVIPSDWQQNSLTENIIHLKIITFMYEMECLRLTDLEKTTREGGKIAYLHGNFGTRKISWRNKQKRDECIAALENACGKRLISIR